VRVGLVGESGQVCVCVGGGGGGGGRWELKKNYVGKKKKNWGGGL
jgi:hypothetical protein